MTSRLATTKLIDELSLGVILIESQLRINTEICYFLHKYGEKVLHPLEHLVWCKLSYVLGFMHPTSKIFDAETELAVQKAFFDRMWDISLTEMVGMIDTSALADTIDFGAIADELNEGIAAHAIELRSFKQAYVAEVRGIIDSVGGVTMNIVEETARKEGLAINNLPMNDQQKYENMYKNLLAIALERAKARDVLRTLHIHSCLRASIRWNKGRKIEANDLYDFNHAAAALAYCDAFFTERSLQTLITQPHVALDKLYNCRVIAAVEEAVGYMNEFG